MSVSAFIRGGSAANSDRAPRRSPLLPSPQSRFFLRSGGSLRCLGSPPLIAPVQPRSTFGGTTRVKS